MQVSLEQVTKENYEAVCDLDVTEDQQDYVASNMWSLVEAMFNEGYETRAICQHERPVGFLMWVKESGEKVSIWRFMVDQQHQQQGIGRIALDLAVQQIKQSPGLQQIEICYNPKNPVARDFYASFGFVEVGMDDEGEDMLAVIQL